jgi:hypothetical protein
MVRTKDIIVCQAQIVKTFKSVKNPLLLTIQTHLKCKVKYYNVIFIFVRHA